VAGWRSDAWRVAIRSHKLESIPSDSFMEKRVFLAIFLCFAVLALYQAYFVPKEPPKPAAAAVVPGAGQPPVPNAPVTPEAGTAPEAPDAAAPLVADATARDIVVSTDTVTAVISSRGATLKSWKLKNYFDAQHQPLELVPQNLPDSFPGPLSLATDDPKLSATLRHALFLPDASSLSLGATTGRLSFEYRDAAGLTAHKAFQFQPDGKAYLVKVDASIDVGGKPQPVVIEWGPAVGSGMTPIGAREFPMRAIQLRDGKVERLSVANLQKQSRYESAVRFAGVEDQYFLSAVLAAPQVVRLDYQPITLPIPDDKENRTRAFITYSVRVAGAASLPFYMGPKEVDAMRAVDPELTGAIDFGMFRFLVVPLLQALKWINHFAGNYGVSIILLTIFINLVIFPLRHRSMVSMRKMQSLQPEVKAIQDRYAKYKITDPERQKMNQEMMALYKQRGVNPASGCVPMLLTMPVLFAFYAMLSASIELRGTPFFGWLHDLSVKDPYYITPVLMGATMFWQQRMMPSTADPVQQKMFMFMPLIFTTMFLAAPSGLVVYWLVSNLLAIGQQYTTNRLIGAPVRPARALPPKTPGGRK
jgi:YidC/Oxa1 family membrane protein insertase